MISPSAPASAVANLGGARAAPGRGLGSDQQGGQAPSATDPAAPQTPAADPTAANTDSPAPSTGASATPTPATFGQTLAASKAKPAAPARSAARKPAPSAPVSPEMVLASLSGTSAPATASDPAPENAARGNNASPEALATTVNASPAGTATPAAGATALQSLSLMLGDEGASEPSAHQDEGSSTAASDSPSPSGGAISKAAALPSPLPAAASLMPRALQSSSDPSGGNSQDLAAAPDTGAALRSDAAALATETAHPKVEQLTLTGPGPSGSGDGASATSPSPSTLTAVASTGGGVQTTAAPTTQAPTGPTVEVQAPVGSSGWAQEVGMRLHLLAQQGISSASLRLTPAQLGPVEVKISVHENAASVWFGAAQSETRSALESSLPKLRELFASQGMNLAHAGVSDQSARGAQREPQPAAAVAPAVVARVSNATHVTSVQPARQGLVDIYA